MISLASAVTSKHVATSMPAEHHTECKKYQKDSKWYTLHSCLSVYSIQVCVALRWPTGIPVIAKKNFKKNFTQPVNRNETICKYRNFRLHVRHTRSENNMGTMVACQKYNQSFSQGQVASIQALEPAGSRAVLEGLDQRYLAW